MAQGINVNIASDTRKFEQGVRSGLVSPIQDAQKTLDELGAAGTETGGKLERTFEAQQHATQQLQGNIDSLNEAMRTHSASAAGSMSGSFKKATHESEEGLKELKDSSRQNAIQTAASFNGSFDSISGGVQGLLSEFLAGFGPAGMIAGLALAGGLGLLTQAVDGVGTATQADKQAVSDLASEYVAAGAKGKRSFDDVHTALTAMMTDTDGSAIISLQTAWDAAHKAGADYQGIVDSIAEADPVAIGRAKASVDQLVQSHHDAADAANAQSRMSGQASSREASAAQTLQAALGKAQAQALAAARAQDLAAKAGISDFQRKADLINQLHTGYTDTAGAASDYEKKESGLLDVRAYIKAMQQKQQALLDYQNTLSESKLTPEAKAYIESLGADDAAAFMAGYKKASPQQQRQLDAIWTAAGRTNAKSYGAALGDDLQNLEVPGPKVKGGAAHGRKYAQELTAAAQRYLDAHPTMAHSSTPVARTPYGKPIY